MPIFLSSLRPPEESVLNNSNLIVQIPLLLHKKNYHKCITLTLHIQLQLLKYSRLKCYFFLSKGFNKTVNKNWVIRTGKRVVL